MREKLVRSDKLECVIGLGPNLFYNAPMEACIVICRSKKPDDRRGQVLFINAVNEVTRKNAESNLEPQHIEKIANAYAGFTNVEGFAAKVSIRDIEKNNFLLSLPLYAKDPSGGPDRDSRTRQEVYEEWVSVSGEMESLYDALNEMIGGAQDA